MDELIKQQIETTQFAIKLLLEQNKQLQLLNENIKLLHPSKEIIVSKKNEEELTEIGILKSDNEETIEETETFITNINYTNSIIQECLMNEEMDLQWSENPHENPYLNLAQNLWMGLSDETLNESMFEMKKGEFTKRGFVWFKSLNLSVQVKNGYPNEIIKEILHLSRILSYCVKFKILLENKDIVTIEMSRDKIISYDIIPEKKENHNRLLFARW